MSAERKTSRAAAVAAGCLAMVLCTLLWAAAPPKPKAGHPGAAPAPPPKPKPTTHTVKRGPFRIEIKTKGIFQAKTMAEVAFRPEAWAELVVASAVEPGTTVKKGEVVLKLDTARIDESIRAQEAGRELSDAAIKLLEADLAALKKTTPLDLAAAERAKKTADEDLQRYQRTDRAASVKSSKYALERAEHYLSYQQEELRQLERMYKADDLTEETEEIILKRARHAVKRAEYSLEVAKRKADRDLKVDLPRRDIAMKEAAERQAIALAKAKVAVPTTLTKARLEMAKQKRAQQKAAEKLRKLKKDRAAMVVKSPLGGIVYYGPCADGNWPKLSQSLKPGTKLLPNVVVMTIVQPRPILVRATVPETQLRHLKVGVGGRVAADALPDLKLKAKVEEVSAIPVGPGTFALRIAVEVPKGATQLVPGMSGTVKLVPYEKKHALAVPAAAVFPDERDETKTIVYARKKGGGHEKVPVKVVRRADKQVEIEGRLKDGTVLLLQKPKKGK